MKELCSHTKCSELQIISTQKTILRVNVLNTIRDKIKEINNNEDEVENVEDESIQELLTPNVWENYMVRYNELENMTFSEMVMG